MVSGTVSHKMWDEKGINGCQKTRIYWKKEKQGREASDENMKEDEYEKVCFLCRRPESKTGPMITLPQNIHICTECMQKSFDTMNNSNMNYGDLMSHMPNISMMDLIKYSESGIRETESEEEKENGRKETGIYHEGCSAAT